MFFCVRCRTYGRWKVDFCSEGTCFPPIHFLSFDESFSWRGCPMISKIIGIKGGRRHPDLIAGKTIETVEY